MATVKIDRFGGIAPRQHPTLLSDGMAVVAHNVRLKSGKLVPLRQPQKITGVAVYMENGLVDKSDAKSMHVWRKADGSFDFLMFPGVTWLAPGNIADDDKTRVIISGSRTGSASPDKPVLYLRDINGAKVIHEICKTSLPKPEASRVKGPIAKAPETKLKGYVTVAQLTALSVKTEGDLYVMKDAGTIEQTVADVNEDIVVAVGSQVVWDGAKWVFLENYSGDKSKRYTNFFWTWVDKFGYESPVSEPSDEIEYIDGDAIRIEPPASGSIPEAAEKVRVYKVVTGMESGRIQFIKEDVVDNISGGVVFDVKDENAGEVMPEIESPPMDLTCIHDVPGGFYCGFAPSAPKTVCLSDIDLLYSWPIAYRYDIADNIVALAVTSNSVFALTDGWPYVLSGTAPESMSVAKLAGPAACVSPRGVCVYRNAVYYVSNAGLMTIYNSADAGTVCQNITDKIFTKDQWLALNPSSCIMGQFDGALFLFFAAPEGGVYSLSFMDAQGVLHTEQSPHIGLVIDLMENMQVAVTTHDEVARCLCVDNAEDKMYYVREGV